MDNKPSLRNTFDNLVNSGRSGVVALCGDTDAENGLDYIAYFHSLGVVYVVRAEFGNEYFDADSNSFVTRTLNEFSARQDRHTLAELGLTESEFLEKALSKLQWDMTHELPDPESEFTDPVPETIGDGYWAFTLFGLGGLESDIRRFHELLLGEGRFTVAGNGFSLGWCLDETDRRVYVLSRQRDDIITDDETGKQCPVFFYTPILDNYDWRTLYAKARTSIYLNHRAGRTK